MTTAEKLAYIQSLEALAKRDEKAFLRRAIRDSLMWVVLSLLGGMILPVIGLAGIAFVWYLGGDEMTVILLIVGAAVLLGGMAWVIQGLGISFGNKPDPEEFKLTKEEAPELFRVVEEVCKEVGGSKLKGIFLTLDFNAAAMNLGGRFPGCEQPALVLGLPLLETFSVDQLRGILAHEFAHLSLRQSRVRWLVGLGAMYLQLSPKLQIPAAEFFSSRFEAPRFRLTAANTVLARLFEYDADKWEVKLTGPREAAASLLLMEVWMRFTMLRFYPVWWHRASTAEDVPPRSGFHEFLEALRAPLSTEEQLALLEQVMRRRTAPGDTHPSLTERLESIGFWRAGMPITDMLISAPAAVPASTLLGKRREHYIDLFAKIFKANTIRRWRNVHANAVEARKRIAKLEAAAATAPLTTEEEWELAEMRYNLAAPAEEVALLEAFLVRFPNHPNASLTLGAKLLGESDDRGIEFIETAIKGDSRLSPSGLETLSEYYDSIGREIGRLEIAERIEKYNAELKKSKAERLEISASDTLMPCTMSPSQREKLLAAIQETFHIREAWLFDKKVTHLADQPCHYLVMRIDLKGVEWERVNEVVGSVYERVRARLNLPLWCKEWRKLSGAAQANVQSVPGAVMIKRD